MFILELNYLDRHIQYPDCNVANCTVNNWSLSKQLDLSRHPNVTGPKYKEEKLAISWSNFLGWNTSGILGKLHL